METKYGTAHLSIVVAMTKRRVIGSEGDMPWGRTIVSDLARFKRITENVGCVIAGRKTHESIMRSFGRVLPNRHMIVLTRGSQFEIDGLESVDSVEAACELVARRRGKACVIGGGEVYKAFLPLASKVHLTTISAPNVEGDTFFPDLGIEWTCTQYLPPKQHDERDSHPTSYQIWERL